MQEFTLLALVCFATRMSALSVNAATDNGDRGTFQDNPIRKVVLLLQDMEDELKNELDDDKKVFDMLSCWCETNDKEKTQAIETAMSTTEQLEASLKENKAKVSELKTRRKETTNEKNSNFEAMQQAKDLRMKENKAFHAEETGLMEAIKACEQAIVVLSKHHTELPQIKSVGMLLQQARVPELVLTRGGTVGQVESQVLKEFVEASQGATSFLAIPGFKSYTPQSGQIFGILKQMTSDFSDDLKAANKAEQKSQTEFEALKVAKEDEIASAEQQIVQIDSDIADLGEKTAQESKELENAKSQLAMDEVFLANLKKKCSMTSTEFDKRVKSRLEEVKAVEDTIQILNNDDTYDLMGKTLVSFLQTSAVEVADTQEVADTRHQATFVLQQASRHYHSPRIALIAASAQLDEFSKVKAEIGMLLAELAQQQKDEQKHRDYCIDSMNTNKRDTAEAYDKKASLQTKMADLEKELETLQQKIAENVAASKEMQKQMKRASEQREAENADFQQTILDQRLTQSILEKALTRMKQVYALLLQQHQPGAPHIQTSGTHTDPGNGPARFKKYEQNAAGKRIVAMIEKVIVDSKKTEAEAIASEEDAQTAYEDFMKDSNKALKEYGQSRVSMLARKAKAESELTATKDDLMSKLKDLEGLNTLLADLHKSCDFIIDTFSARQEARAAEMDSLREAKNILSGMQ